MKIYAWNEARFAHTKCRRQSWPDTAGYTSEIQALVGLPDFRCCAFWQAVQTSSTYFLFILSNCFVPNDNDLLRFKLVIIIKSVIIHISMYALASFTAVIGNTYIMSGTDWGTCVMYTYVKRRGKNVLKYKPEYSSISMTFLFKFGYVQLKTNST